MVPSREFGLLGGDIEDIQILGGVDGKVMKSSVVVTSPRLLVPG